MLFPLCAQPVFAETGTQMQDAEVSGDYSGFAWTLDEYGTLTITGSGNMPDGYETPWWTNRDKIKKVVVKDGVTSIGDYAFLSCPNLAQAELPDSVISIGCGAFQNCTSLKLTKLPGALTSIENGAFYSCTNLALTELPDSVTSIEDGAFQNCTNLALTKLPSGVTSIGDYTFFDCANLALKQLPDNVTSIGERAFHGCTSLALTGLPDGVTAIGALAFGNCTNLALTKLPDSVTAIGIWAFEYCPNLALTALPAGLTSIGEGTFIGCTNLALTELPDNVTSIGASAFHSCTSLALMKLPDGLTSIDRHAFYGCTGLTEITFTGNQAPTLGINVFDSCTALKTIYIPNGAKGYGGGNWPTDKNIVESYRITVQTDGGGTASASPTSVAEGTKITLTATPNSGYHFKEWQVVSGSVTITNNQFTMPAENVTVKAVFEKDSTGSSRPSGGGGSKRPGSSRPTTPTTPTTPSQTQVQLDTQTVTMCRGAAYQFLVKYHNDVANMTVSSANPAVATVALADARDPRGAKYEVTATGIGTTQILVTYSGQTVTMTVNVQAPKGSMTLDTVQYTMAPGNQYTIGAFIRDENGNPLSAEQVRELVANGRLNVRDSRTGSIVNLEQLSNGHFRVTGKNEGIAYIIYEIGGTHASVRVDVKNGVKQGGSAVRNTSYFTE